MTTAQPQTMPRHVKSADGTAIAYWSSGTGPPLVLVHGAMSDHQRWRITPWLEPYHTVHAVDRRGRGGSGDGPDWSLEREVEDVIAVIEAVAAESGLPVDLLGHSLGGVLALRAAGRTDRVRRLVVYEAPVNEPPQPADLLDRMQACWPPGGRTRWSGS
jgi:pimeloyl-ACP methyl ester carboxylesterase